MKSFIYRIFVMFIIPLLLILLLIVLWDPFKIYFNYSHQNEENISVNREYNCLKLLENNTDTISNFIVGNSRSLAFRTENWSDKINVNPKTCFHYDASGMGLYRLTNSIEYLSSHYKINNLLIIMDVGMFSEVENPKNIFGIQPPRVSHINKLSYFLIFIKASLDPIFIASKVVYYITNKYFDFMKYYIPTNKYKSRYLKNGDIIFSYDQAIKLDSINYYQNIPKMYELYNRDNIQFISEKVIFDTQIQHLHKLQKTLIQNKINYKIVISPLYNQIKLNRSDLEYLYRLLGQSNIYDFSGINVLTSNITNYYESSHFKPYVANKIMDSIYFTPSESH